MPLKITSSAFQDQGTIPKKFTCDGEDVSPKLAWTGVPDGTQSFAIIMDDPDAPPGTWVHWVLYDLPALDGLPEGLAKDETIEGGGKHGVCWGVDNYSRIGYYGPCPPPGKPHRYIFKLYALGKTLGITPRKTKEELLKAMQGASLGEAQLTGLYGRPR